TIGFAATALIFSRAPMLNSLSSIVIPRIGRLFKSTRREGFITSNFIRSIRVVPPAMNEDRSVPLEQASEASSADPYSKGRISLPPFSFSPPQPLLRRRCWDRHRNDKDCPT